ncbi:MAG: hypothetical protein EOO75_05420, partial [Myxococcales bacterium]
MTSQQGSSSTTGKGGVIADGTYALSSLVFVPSPGYTLNVDPTPVIQVLRFEGGLTSMAIQSGGKTARAVASYETECESLTLRHLCPDTLVEHFSYSTGPGYFTLIAPTQGATVVSRYERLLEQGAGGTAGPG